MTRQVICIARTLGSGGEGIGHAVAEALGYRYIDDEIIVRAAEKAQITPEEMAKAEKPPGLIDRLFESLGKTAADPEGWGAYAAVAAAASPTSEALIELAVRETAREGKVVIVAHGASIVLGPTVGVLRVLITGSPSVRADRLQVSRDIGEKSGRKEVEKSDKERADYLKRFYDVHNEEATYYDLVLNTDTIDDNTAVHLITEAARS